MLTSLNKISLFLSITPSQVLDACGSISEGNATLQTSFGETADSVRTFARLYREQSSRRVLVALSSSLAKISCGHQGNQRQFVDEGFNIILF